MTEVAGIAPRSLSPLYLPLLGSSGNVRLFDPLQWKTTHFVCHSHPRLNFHGKPLFSVYLFVFEAFLYYLAGGGGGQLQLQEKACSPYFIIVPFSTVHFPACCFSFTVPYVREWLITVTFFTIEYHDFTNLVVQACWEKCLSSLSAFVLQLL